MMTSANKPQKTHEAPVAALRALLGADAFPEPAWQAAVPLFRYRIFSAREHVVMAGEAIENIHFLISGLGRYYYIDAKGREFNKSFSRRGQVLSSVSSLVTGGPSPFYVQTLEPSECVAITYQDLLMLGEAHREWAVLARRMLESLVIKKEVREADLLLLSATERYRKFLIEFADVAGRIPNYHIASYLGITEVALSRIRRRIKLGQG